MKSLNIKTFASACILAALALSSCKKEKQVLAPWVNAGASAEFSQLRIVHAAPNFRLATGQADSINIFANGFKLNGTRLSFGSYFPSQLINSYVGVPPGDVDLKISVGGVVTMDSIPITTLKVKMEKGNFYSLVITDSIMNGSRDSAKIFARDVFTIPITGRIGIRMVHAMNDTATDKRLDIWSVRRTSNLYTNVSPGMISSFTTQSYLGLNDTLIVRRAGTTTELTRLVATFADQRVYTLYLRGDVKLSSGTKAKTFTYYTNR